MKIIIQIALTFVLAGAAFAQGDSPAAMLQYATKFVCGVAPPVTPSAPNPVAAPGRYFTAINVHNPARAAIATVYKKFTVGLPSEKVGAVTQYFEMKLGGDETMQIDCENIARHLNQSPTDFLEGYAVIESARELDVVAVYTAGAGSGFPVTSIHTERVQMRRMPLCPNLNMNISTGQPVWTLVAAPSGQVPRAPNTLGASFFPLPNTLWITGTATGQTALPPGSVWEYEMCFCICPGARVNLNLKGVRVDDKGDFFLNGNSLGTILTQNPPSSQLNAVNNAAAAFFRPGKNCLRVRVTDSFGGFSGLDIDGNITGAAASCQ